MKKQVVFFVFWMLVFTATAFGAVDNIVDYLLKMDDQYYLVVGAEGKGEDVFAASEIAAAMKKDFSVDLQIGVEGKVSAKVSKILVGHPCDNKLIDLPCDDWPYNEGEALIKMIGNDLIIAGSTPEDTRRAAEVITHYKDFPLLEKQKEVIVKGDSLEYQLLILEPVKKQSEFVCGDNVCETGEKVFCFADCLQKSCYVLCAEQKFAQSFCRNVKSNPNVPSCLSGESDFGGGYCANKMTCCCFTPSAEPVQEEQQELPATEEPKKSLLQWLLNAIKEFFAILF